MANGSNGVSLVCFLFNLAANTVYVGALILFLLSLAALSLDAPARRVLP